MKVLGTVASAALLIALGGCNQLGIGGGADANNSASNAAAGNTSGGKDAGGGNIADAAPTADASGGKDGAGVTPASSGAVNLDRTYVLGRWADYGEDCADAIEFTQDGRFITKSGAGGLWNLEGDALTMTGNQTATIRIRPIDQNTMTVINADGSLGRSTRC